MISFAAFALTIAANMPQDMGMFHVDQVNTKVAPAGRLGKRVSQTLTVSKDGKTFTLLVSGNYHTRFQPLPKMFAAGDDITVMGYMKNGKLLAPRTGITKK